MVLKLWCEFVFELWYWCVCVDDVDCEWICDDDVMWCCCVCWIWILWCGVVDEDGVCVC